MLIKLGNADTVITCDPEDRVLRHTDVWFRDGRNMMDEIRSASLLHRLTWGDRAPSAYDCLKLATAAAPPCLAGKMTWVRLRKDSAPIVS